MSVLEYIGGVWLGTLVMLLPLYHEDGKHLYASWGPTLKSLQVVECNRVSDQREKHNSSL